MRDLLKADNHLLDPASLWGPQERPYGRTGRKRGGFALSSGRRVGEGL